MYVEATLEHLHQSSVCNPVERFLTSIFALCSYFMMGKAKGVWDILKLQGLIDPLLWEYFCVLGLLPYTEKPIKPFIV
jgi:hypothetical protein